MEIIVQKYGGSSIANTSRIKKIAKKIIITKNKGKKVVVVVSAPGNTTDDLINLAKKITKSPPERELDMLLSTGEQVSIALLCMAIHNLGEQAISFTGSQVGIVTDQTYTKAKILKVNVERILKELKKDKIVIVAGFQGVTQEDEITTLGRGGSDTTAVALASSLKAERCEIFTDVEGVFTADPSLVPDSTKLSEISYDEMLEMAATGAKVLNLRAVEYGKGYDVPIYVGSSFSEKEGTWIRKENEIMEKAVVSGVTYDVGEIKITLRDVPDSPGVAAKVFQPLAEAEINVDMIVQNISEKGLADISFTILKEDLSKVKVIVKKIEKAIGAREVLYDKNIAKVSIIGAGMRTHPGVAAKMFIALAKKRINIIMISTSSIKISCVIESTKVKEAVQVLHKAFKLSEGVLKEEYA